MPTTPAAQIALSHRPKPPAPHSGQMDSKYPRNKVKERDTQEEFFIVHWRNSPVCGFKVQHTECGTKRRRNWGWGPLEVQSCKQTGKKKMVKDSSRKRHFFCKYHANRQLASLKRTPINNRSGTPSIPAQGLRAQGKKKPKCLLAFQDIWHSCDYIWFFVFYSSLKRIKWHTVWEGKRGLTQQTPGEVRKYSSIIFLCLFFSFWHIKHVVGV